MNRLELFRTLRRHRHLARVRMVDRDRNRVAGILIGILEAFVALYLLMFAVIFALAANDSRTLSSLEFIFCLAPGMLTVDFLVRFVAQQTPSQMVKPYALLPLRRYTCVDFFIAGQMLSFSNLIWFVLLVPYCIMSVLFSFGLLECVLVLFVFWILELCVSQYYLIVRTLLTDSLLWWLLPVAVVLLLLLLPGADLSLASPGDIIKSYSLLEAFRFYGGCGALIERHSVLPVVGAVALLAVLLAVNRRLQYTYVKRELSRQEKVVRVSGRNRMAFLERMGEVGLYLSLEIRLVLRNKSPRSSFLTAVVIAVAYTALVALTDIYDSPDMKSFWCIYDYTIFGAVSLVKVMCYEGNYIDGLMVRRENILQILKAKYIFNCIMMLFPMILMLPVVASGKWSLLMVISYGVFTAGFQFFLLFQLAVTNRSAVPLNAKLISKNGIESSKWQVVMELVCLFVPAGLVCVMLSLFGETVSYVIMLIIGMAFVLTRNIWLRDVYNRFMRYRYINMEGFRASR